MPIDLSREIVFFFSFIKAVSPLLLIFIKSKLLIFW